MSEETTTTTTMDTAAGTASSTTTTTTTTKNPEEKEEEIEKMLVEKIASLGEQIKVAKMAKKPKEEWDPILKEMLSLKEQYKTQLGKDYGPSSSSSSSKKKQAGGGGEKQQQQVSSDKNKEKNEKKRLEKQKREAEKEAKRAERERREKEKAAKLLGQNRNNFGDVERIQSSKITNQIWTPINHLIPSMKEQEVCIRGHIQTIRAVGKGAFVLVRSSLYTVQCVAFETTTTKDGTTISNAMIKYIASIPLESVVDVTGIVKVPDVPVESATQSNVELSITKFHTISRTELPLPFLMEDACRPDTIKETDVGAYNEDDDDYNAAAGAAGAGAGAAAGATSAEDGGMVRVGQKIRLDYRWLDLRTPANQAIFRIESMVGCLFRECLLKKGFIEIHTPKLIGGASEGGSDVFTLDYFGQPACLAMSPQLHKQISAACSGFERVFETGPVFRAENSNTRRHLCEFTGFDIEMIIHEHYDEVLDVFSDLFIYIFDGIQERCKDELERIREQHPFTDLKYLRPTLKLTYAEGCQLLRNAGIQQDDYDDLSTENEKKLGDIVSEKYNTDFFFMDKYPLDVRPFYTMPDPENPKLSNSYDFFIRGQEILSGAQRIHEPTLLKERAAVHNISYDDIESYINSFCYGSMPHGGGGIGLERVIMLYLNLPNIRKTSWFPRDPKRISP